MAFYMEYPRRKVPHGIPPVHHPEPPSLESAVKDLAIRVATTAEQTQLSHPSACQSPKVCEPNEVQVEVPRQQSQSTETGVPQNITILSSPIEKSESLTQDTPSAEVPIQAQLPTLNQTFHCSQFDVTPPSSPPNKRRKEIESILYPSRIISPRPSSQKRVKWPDIEAQEESKAQKGKEPETIEQACMNDLEESINTVLGACCGLSVDMSCILPQPSPPVAEPPLSPLETVYEVERFPDSHLNNLTVHTNLPMRIEAVQTPSANDPIMSFREKKLKYGEKQVGLSSNGGVGTGGASNEDCNTAEGRDDDDDVLSSDSEDWAPVTRPLHPVPPPVAMNPLQMQIRMEAQRLENERRERKLKEHSMQSHSTPRAEKIVREPILQSLPSELSEKQEHYSRPPSSSSILSRETWTLNGRRNYESDNLERYSRKQSSDSNHSRTTWNVPDSSEANPVGKKPPRTGINKMLGMRRKGKSKQRRDSTSRSSEIVWKSDRRLSGIMNNGKQTRRTNEDSWDSASESVQSKSSHVSEISWRTSQGRRVAMLKEECRRSERNWTWCEREQSYDEMGPSEVNDLESIMSSETEFDDERYVRSQPKERQQQQRRSSGRRRGESPAVMHEGRVAEMQSIYREI